MTAFTEGIREIKGKSMLPCMLSVVILSISGWIQNGSLYSEIAFYFGLAREINTFLGAFLFLALAIVIQRKPTLFDKRIMALIAVMCAIASPCVLALAIPAQNPLFTVIGLAFGKVAGTWGIVMLALSFSHLSSFKSVTAALAFGYALSEIVRLLAPMPSIIPGIVLTSVCDLAMLALLYRSSSTLLDTITQSPAAADIELSNPGSFLLLSHPLFMCALLFNFASGYALTLNEVEHAPVPIGLIGAAMIGVALWLVFSKNKTKEDSLFTFSALLVIAGFLIAPFTFFTGQSLPNGFIRIGINTFGILLWMVIVAVGRRNLLALIPTLGFARFMGSIGTNLGAITGHTSNDLVGMDSQLAALIASIAVFIFIAFLWVYFRKFSFSETIRGVAGVKAPEISQPESDIEQRCQTIGAEHGLTERETEIFAMLARGRNGQFIMEHYVVSRNTVKSHIKHIYQKLDVHSQQELIDLVESAA